MLIGIEAERANNPQKTGVEHYAKQLIQHLAEIDRQNQYILYLRTKPEEWFLKLPENFELKIMRFPLAWTQIRLSWELLLHPVDVLLVPACALPVIHPKKSVITIHDIAWRFYPEAFTGFLKFYLEWSTNFAVSKAFKVIAVSQATKHDLIRHFKVPEQKIAVIYHGYEEENSDYKTQIPNKLQIPQKYILFLSTLQPRKNLEGLIDAFKKLKAEHPELPHKLVIVGKPGWKYEKILEKIQANKNLVVYLNYVSDRDRREILRRAELLILPSFYEGFGLQILESFASSVPVATSKVSSMPEVAGEAAVYFDPHSVQEIKSAMAAVLFDRSLAESLKQKGAARLKHFSWASCAQETLKVLTS